MGIGKGQKLPGGVGKGIPGGQAVGSSVSADPSLVENIETFLQKKNIRMSVYERKKELSRVLTADGLQPWEQRYFRSHLTEDEIAFLEMQEIGKPSPQPTPKQFHHPKNQGRVPIPKPSPPDPDNEEPEPEGIPEVIGRALADISEKVDPIVAFFAWLGLSILSIILLTL